MSGIEGAERDDYDEREAGVARGGINTENQRVQCSCSACDVIVNGGEAGVRDRHWRVSMQRTGMPTVHAACGSH